MDAGEGLWHGPRPVKEPLPERFSDLGLVEALARAVADEGYERPTPIQARCIPPALAGRDLLGLAQTGTGKTAGFALPILQRLSAHRPDGRGPRPIRALVLTPTRELASQIGQSFATYGRHLRLKQAVIFGGVGVEPQRQTLRAGLDILVATPGRLLDLAGQGEVDVRHLEVFVLDEADRMLDMGFIHDVRRVIRLLPERRQTLFFSATMPAEAQALADVLLRDPVTVAVTPVSSTAERIEQEIAFVAKADKRHLLVEVLRDVAMRRVLVFTRTKHGANRVAEHLTKAGVGAMAIHGNKSQGARERALHQFKVGQIRVLVATDIAARGIDIDEISHVVNFDLPEVPEQYVHRIGRTARAGASGFALSFCDEEEDDLLRQIERLIRRDIPVIEGHPYERKRTARPSGGGGGGGGGKRGGGGGGRGGGGGGGPRPQQPRAAQGQGQGQGHGHGAPRPGATGRRGRPGRRRRGPGTGSAGRTGG